MNRRNKFHAKKTNVDGVVFDSAREARRYGELKLLQRAKQIDDLTLQPSFPLRVNGQLVCVYRADFSYNERGKRVVEDSKGFKTRDYIIKRKLFLALNAGIDHREV